MRILADSGATKTDWAFLLDNGEVKRFETIGFSPYFNTSEEIALEVKTKLVVHFSDFDFGKADVFYFGTGCSNDEKRAIVKEALASCFVGAKIEVNHDLYAAARALCGKESGIACILGTGSNSCEYDGNFVTHNITSLGYFFGDCGSGAYMGKTLLQRYFDKQFSEEIMNLLKKNPKFEVEYVLDNMYKKPLPSRFLASYSLVIHELLHYDEIKNLVKKCFNDFILTQLSTYPNYKKLPINVVGSVGYIYAQLFSEVLLENNLTKGKIIKAPMDGLIEFYKP